MAADKDRRDYERRDPDHRRAGDHVRGGRDRRDDRSQDRDYDYRSRGDSSRMRSPGPQPTVHRHSPPAVSNGRPKDDDSEKEEGE